MTQLLGDSVGYEVESNLDLANSSTENLIDWSVYSEHYDDLCFANPAYIANLEDLKSRLLDWDLPINPSVCDIGAGTGSFLLAVADMLPNVDMHHIDFDPAMTMRARSKYASEGLKVSFYESDVRALHLPSSKFDLSICVNTLYSIPEHDLVLNKMRDWTKSGGLLYIIDFGRKVEVLNWAVYILRNRVKELGLKDTIKWYLENSENLKQNRKGAKAQTVGTYWLHSTEEFRSSLEAAGWQIEEIKTCYRDCCDLAICTNPPPP